VFKLSDRESVQLLKDVKKILAMICLSNIGNLKKELLTTELDQRIYDLCTRKSIDEIANKIPEIGYAGVYDRVSSWEKRGLVITEQEPSGRGRPKKYFIKVEEYLR